MRLIAPLHASIASLRIVFPDDACPTMAKLRMSSQRWPAMNLTMSRNQPPCKPREQKLWALSIALESIAQRADRTQAGSLCYIAPLRGQWGCTGDNSRMVLRDFLQLSGVPLLGHSMA